MFWVAEPQGEKDPCLAMPRQGIRPASMNRSHDLAERQKSFLHVINVECETKTTGLWH